MDTKPALKLASAIEVHKAGEISLSRAAEIAGMNIEDFKHVLSKRGVKRTIKPGAPISIEKWMRSCSGKVSAIKRRF